MSHKERFKEAQNRFTVVADKHFKHVYIRHLASLKDQTISLYDIPKIYWSHELLFEAVKHVRLRVCHIPDEYLTEQFLIELIKYDAKTLEYIAWPRQTKEICQQAVKQNKDMLKYVALKFRNEECLTKELLLEAIEHNGEVIKYIADKTYDMCLLAVKKREDALKYVEARFRTEELLRQAVSSNVNAFYHLRKSEQTDELCSIVVKICPIMITKMNDPSIEILIESLRAGATKNFEYYEMLNVTKFQTAIKVVKGDVINIEPTFVQKIEK